MSLKGPELFTVTAQNNRIEKDKSLQVNRACWTNVAERSSVRRLFSSETLACGFPDLLG